jgi:hypothetical protein
VYTPVAPGTSLNTRGTIIAELIELIWANPAVGSAKSAVQIEPPRRAVFRHVNLRILPPKREMIGRFGLGKHLPYTFHPNKMHLRKQMIPHFE